MIGELNYELAVIVSLHTLKTPTNYPHVHPCFWHKWNTAGQTSEMCWKTVKGEMYSLGSPKALTQFLYQRLSLPFFGDVGEQLSENTNANNTASKQGSQNSKDVNFPLESFLNKSQFFWSLQSPAWTYSLWTKAGNWRGHILWSRITHFIMVLKSSELMPLSGSDRRLMMSGSRL